MQKDSPIKSCVDQAIKGLKADGTLTKLQNQYFPGTNPLPEFKPTA